MVSAGVEQYFSGAGPMRVPCELICVQFGGRRSQPFPVPENVTFIVMTDEYESPVRVPMKSVVNVPVQSGKNSQAPVQCMFTDVEFADPVHSNGHSDPVSGSNTWPAHSVSVLVDVLRRPPEQL